MMHLSRKTCVDRRQSIATLVVPTNSPWTMMLTTDKTMIITMNTWKMIITDYDNEDESAENDAPAPARTTTDTAHNY